jgi:hypothetical protein
MAGNLIISQINGGQIGFRNILINGWVNTSYEINQRVLTFAGVSNGEYFADRWKRVDASNMTQIVEESNYKPGAGYCLSGTGVTTQVLTSPSSGNWTLPNIPSTASYIQLELGDTPTDYEWRNKGYELILCQRYYCRQDGEYRFDAKTGDTNNNGDFTVSFMWYFPVSMRDVPTVSTVAESGQTTGPISWLPKSSSGALGTFKCFNPNDLIVRTKAAILAADAEL